MDQVLHTMNAKLTKTLRDDVIVAERDALLVDFAETTLVHELPDRLQRWVTIRDVRLHKLQHLQNGLVHLEEDPVVNLAQAKQLHDLARLGRKLEDASAH